MKQIYTFGLRDSVEKQLPDKVKDAMRICGWDALGVYELVRDELKIEKREAKKLDKTKEDK